jgi:hypothetical protein
MSKPNDIPDDVWEKAGAFAVEDGERFKFAHAILSERERCAQVATLYYDNEQIRLGQWTRIQDGIAAAIRKGESA